MAELGDIRECAITQCTHYVVLIPSGWLHMTAFPVDHPAIPKDPCKHHYVLQENQFFGDPIYVWFRCKKYGCRSVYQMGRRKLHWILVGKWR